MKILKKDEIYMNLLKNKSFMAFWGSTTLLRLASNILQFALAIYVLDLTGSALVFSTVLSVIILPRLIFTPISGYLADCRNCIHVLRWCALSLVVLMASFFIIHTVIKPLSIPLIYILVIFLEICETLISASDAKAIVLIIEKDKIASASKLSSLDDGIVEIASPVIGGFAYGVFGLSTVLFVALFIEAVAFLLMMIVRTNGVSHCDKLIEKSKINIVRDSITSYKSAVISLKEYPFVVGIVLFAPLFNFFIAPLFSIIVPHFIRITLNSNVDVYTAYNLILGVAGLIAPFIAMMVIKNDDEKKANMNGTLFLAGMLVFLSFALNYLFNIQSEVLLYIVVGIMAIAVIIITVMNIATTITIKSKIPEDILGRIVSIIQLCAVVAMPLGQLLYGYFADNFQATISFIFSAFGLCITYLVMRKTYERLDEDKNVRA